MYFKDLYKINPNTDGASFLSAFFLLFTISRLVCGLFVEKVGYMRALLFSAFIVLAVCIAGFLLGEKGIYLLPSLGFFVAQFWPILMAVAIVSFGGDAPVFSSAMIAISGLLNAGLQFIVGLTNKILGPAWGYRNAVVYTLLLIAALGIMHRKLKARE
jgi:fucose permease